MERYEVESERIGGDIFPQKASSKEDAINKAIAEWEHLTRFERQKSAIHVDIVDEEGIPIDRVWSTQWEPDNIVKISFSTKEELKAVIDEYYLCKYWSARPKTVGDVLTSGSYVLEIEEYDYIYEFDKGETVTIYIEVEE